MVAIPHIMGIVNITPDSFSDGGAYHSVEAALAHMEQLLADGAAVLDIGAESTRPNAVSLSAEEEWERLSPVLSAARKRFADALLSVDTRHSQTARNALASGADWINDVSGGQDPAMLETVAEAGCVYVAMHSLSIPADPANVLPEETDVVKAMAGWMQRRRTDFMQAGIAEDKLLFDPGIGFGKTAGQSWQLLRAAKELADAAGGALLIGHSRKSFLSTVSNASAQERDLETHVISSALVDSGVRYLRVHDVAGTRRALAVAGTLAGEGR
ncbi:MAG: dihydropteroate synthase [Rickettsiales bacterium]